MAKVNGQGGMLHTFLTDCTQNIDKNILDHRYDIGVKTNVQYN